MFRESVSATAMDSPERTATARSLRLRFAQPLAAIKKAAPTIKNLPLINVMFIINPLAWYFRKSYAMGRFVRRPKHFWLRLSQTRKIVWSLFSRLWHMHSFCDVVLCASQFVAIDAGIIIAVYRGAFVFVLRKL